MADNGGKGRLNEKEVLSVVRQLNEQIPESVIKQRFKVGDLSVAISFIAYDGSIIAGLEINFFAQEPAGD